MYYHHYTRVQMDIFLCCFYLCLLIGLGEISAASYGSFGHLWTQNQPKSISIYRAQILQVFVAGRYILSRGRSVSSLSTSWTLSKRTGLQVRKREKKRRKEIILYPSTKQRPRRYYDIGHRPINDKPRLTFFVLQQIEVQVHAGEHRLRKEEKERDGEAIIYMPDG